MPTPAANTPELLTDIVPGRMYPKFAVLKSVLGWGRGKVYHQQSKGRIRLDVSGKLVSGIEVLRLAGLGISDAVPLESKADKRKRRMAARERIKTLIASGG